MTLTDEQNAAVARETAEQMDARLDYIQVKPAIILEISQGVGLERALLAKRYPSARILSAPDLSLEAYTVDLIFANLLILDQPLPLDHWRCLLKPMGLLMFAIIGTDMQSIGDALLQAGFRDPVLDHEYWESHALIYGQAWGTQHFSPDETGVVKIPISSVRR